MRSRNPRTMHFSGGPLATSAVAAATNGGSPVLSSNNNSGSAVANVRDMDPIAGIYQ